MQLQERTCIYCLQSKPFSKSKKLRKEIWNREHVLHDAFGSFAGDNLTLVGSVCQSCNQHMGDSIDNVLTRSSYEAIQRFKYGQKNTKHIAELSMEHLQLIVESNDEWNGVLVEFVDDNGVLGQKVASQYAFKDRETNKWVHINERDFHSRDPRIQRPALHLHDGPWKTFSRNEAADERLRRRAYYKGVHLNLTDSISPPAKDPRIVLSFSIATSHQRAIAKIAYNYLAKVTEKSYSKLVLNDAFDPLRKFILDGVNPGWQVVRIANNPMISGETQERRLTNGHLVSIECKTIANAVVWIGQVTIYNHLVFDVVLTKQFGMMFYPIAHCHHWDIENHTCTALPGLHRDLSLIGLPGIHS